MSPNKACTAGSIKMNSTSFKRMTCTVHVFNNLTSVQKLDMALIMAESLAELHGFRGGVILHGDAHPVQWLRNARGQVKLNDFNNAQILDFDPETNTYCKHNRCWGGCYYRAPEEFRCIQGNEQVDTYIMGHLIYSLLTGLYPFYQHVGLKAHTIQDKIIDDKETPYVDPRYRTRSPIEAGLVKVMEQCWIWDPDDRIEIYEAVKQLRALKASQ